MSMHTESRKIVERPSNRQAGTTATKLAYILAASHSGSTLLSMLLGCHPQVVTVGELKFSPKAIGDLDRYRCSCGALIRACGFWDRVRNGMAARGFEFDLAQAGTDYRISESRYAGRLLGPMYQDRFLEGLRDVALSLSGTWRQHLPEIHRRNAALASVVCEITAADVVVDSSKIALRLKYLLRNPELDVKVIRLVRDGRAVALTYMDPAGFADAQNPALRSGGMGGSREDERLGVATAARRWRRCMKEAESILQWLPPSQWVKVRYEDYCRDPDTTLDRLYRFLDVEPHRPPREFRTMKQHVIGNGMRLDTTSEVRLDERWRDVLTEQDLRTFDQIAGETNGQYGYR
jgi:hypothetical protein